MWLFHSLFSSSSWFVFVWPPCAALLSVSFHSGHFICTFHCRVSAMEHAVQLSVNFFWSCCCWPLKHNFLSYFFSFPILYVLLAKEAAEMDCMHIDLWNVFRLKLLVALLGFSSLRDKRPSGLPFRADASLFLEWCFSPCPLSITELVSSASSSRITASWCFSMRLSYSHPLAYSVFVAAAHITSR